MLAPKTSLSVTIIVSMKSEKQPPFVASHWPSFILQHCMSSCFCINNLAPHAHCCLAVTCHSACAAGACLRQQSDARSAAEQVKMRELGCASHPAYRLTCYLDHKAMVTCRTDKYGETWSAAITPSRKTTILIVCATVIQRCAVAA